MKNPQTDDVIQYLTNRDNLTYTLEILRQAELIRQHAFYSFWLDVRKQLVALAPARLRAKKLDYRLWPTEKANMLREDAGVYVWPSTFTGERQHISYGIALETGKSLFFGLCWEQEPKARLAKVPSVKKLIDYLQENEFGYTAWWPGWQYIMHEQEPDGVLLAYANDRQRLHRQIAESFWPLVEKTFDMVVKANEAVRS